MIKTQTQTQSDQVLTDEVYNDQVQNNKENKIWAPKKSVSAKLKLQIKLSQNHTCEICKSNYALEIDHQKPKALGGSNDLSNLRLLCKSCNQRAAIKSFGQLHMNQFL